MIQLLSTLPMQYMFLVLGGIVLVIGFTHALVKVGRREPDYGEYKETKN